MSGRVVVKAGFVAVAAFGVDLRAASFRHETQKVFWSSAWRVKEIRRATEEYKTQLQTVKPRDESVQN